MTDKTVYFFTESWSADKAAKIVHDLALSGLDMVNPGTGGVFALDGSEANAGERIVTTRAKLLDSLALEDLDEQSFQLWLDSSSDIVCRFTRSGDGIAADFYLDGLGRATNRVASTIIRSLLRTDDDIVGLVADLTGYAVDSDWRSIVYGGPGRVSAVPELIVCRLGVAASVGSRLGSVGHAWQERGGLAVLDPSGLIKY